jgi:hypothetical protein
MTFLVLLLLLPLGFLLAEGRWRDGVLFSVVIGFLQDPLRKITPDQPGLFVGIVLVGISLTAITLYNRLGRLELPPLFSNDQRLIGVLEAFLALLALQTLNGLVQVGSPALTFLGLGFYLAPILALWVGFQFALQPAAVKRFLQIYIGMALLFAVTLLLSYRGIESPLFEEVGGGVQINVVELGAMMQGFVGFWRSSEIAAWHLGAAACFLMILAVSSRNPTLIGIAFVLAAALLVLSTLTGRRKVLTLVGGFVGFFALLIAWRGDPRVRSNILLGLGSGGLLLGLLVSLGADPTKETTLGAMITRTTRVWEEVGDRFNVLGYNAIVASLDAAGPFGFGIGASLQGADSLGIRANVGTWAAEGGLGKIASELGLAGIALFAVIVVLFGALFWRIMRQLRYAPAGYGLLNFGLTAFLAANLPNFSVAGQVYGDPFVLTVMGLCAGFVLASPVVLQAHLQSQRTSIATPMVVLSGGGAGA